MRSKITFATFDPVFLDTPRECTECSNNPPVFRYEFSHGVEEQEPEVGFCCLTCAPQILSKLAGAECQAWQEEEAALKGADVDIRELHQWRISAFHR